MGTAQESADQVAAQLNLVAQNIAPEVANLEEQVSAGERPDLGSLMVAAEALGELVDTVEELPAEILVEDCCPSDDADEEMGSSPSS